MKSDRYQDDGLRRRLMILWLILISVGLVVVMMAARSAIRQREFDREANTGIPAGTEGEMTLKMTAAAAGEAAGTGKETSEESYRFSEGTLEANDNPELNELFAGYFQAKLLMDAERAQSFFMERDFEKSEEEQKRLLWSGKYIEGYREITCYTLPGPEEDTYLAYVYYQIKFYQSAVPAPSLSFAYVARDKEGKYKIQNGELTDAVKGYISEAERSEEVTNLSRQVQEEFAQALAEDEDLAAIYSVAMSGPKSAGETESPES